MIQAVGKDELPIVAALGTLLWQNHSAEALVQEFSDILSKGNAQFFLKYEQDVPVGFAQCQLRFDYVEGTQTSPVGYLEGIFVKENYRNRGYGQELLTACEAWAKEKGCREFASDCEMDNTDSIRFHKAMQFNLANRIVCFTKPL